MKKHPGLDSSPPGLLCGGVLYATFSPPYRRGTLQHHFPLISLNPMKPSLHGPGATSGKEWSCGRPEKEGWTHTDAIKLTHGGLC